MTKKKLLSAMLAFALSASAAIPAAAADIAAPGTGQTPSILTQEASVFSVSVPTGLPVNMASDGTVTVATDAEIRNNSYGPVEVTAISVEPQGDWSLVDFATDFTTKKVGLHEFAFQLQGANVATDGSCATDGFAVIPGNSASPLSYDANVAIQKTSASGEVMANVVLTLNWATEASADQEPSPDPNPDAAYENFIVTADNRSMVGYTGAEGENLVIPETFVGEDGTNYKVVGIGDRAFMSCANLSSIKLPDSVQSIGKQAFWRCTSLTTITIPDSVQSIGTAAFGCTSLTSITIPNSVQSIGDSAFDGCASLTSITIPDSVQSIGQSAFWRCTSLTTINIPDSVQSIGITAFGGCSKLTSINIPDSVQSIGKQAFSSCTSLTSITIPNSVQSIGDSAFYNVPHITYHGTATGSPWGATSMN